MQVKKYVEQLLGRKARDKITGMEGVITTVSFDLYGCVQIILKPPFTDGKLLDGAWFDVCRLEILDDQPIIDLPDFNVKSVLDYKKGPENKPIK